MFQQGEVLGSDITLGTDGVTDVYKILQQYDNTKGMRKHQNYFELIHLESSCRDDIDAHYSRGQLKLYRSI